MRLITRLLIAAALLTGCEAPPEYTQAYVDFLDEHNSDTNYYCDESTGFLMLESIGPKDDGPTTSLVMNKNSDPVVCP